MMCMCCPQVHAGDRLKEVQPSCSLPPAPSARHEYSSMDVTLEVVSDIAAAVDHIHANGSGHTGDWAEAGLVHSLLPCYHKLPTQAGTERVSLIRLFYALPTRRELVWPDATTNKTRQ